MSAVTRLVVPGPGLDVIPGGIGTSMDTGNLIPAQELRLVDGLQPIQRQKVQIPLIRVLLKLADFETYRHTAIASTAGLNTSDTKRSHLPFRIIVILLRRINEVVN